MYVPRPYPKLTFHFRIRIKFIRIRHIVLYHVHSSEILGRLPITIYFRNNIWRLSSTICFRNNMAFVKYHMFQKQYGVCQVPQQYGVAAFAIINKNFLLNACNSFPWRSADWMKTGLFGTVVSQDMKSTWHLWYCSAHVLLYPKNLFLMSQLPRCYYTHNIPMCAKKLRFKKLRF